MSSISVGSFVKHRPEAGEEGISLCLESPTPERSPPGCVLAKKEIVGPLLSITYITVRSAEDDDGEADRNYFAGRTIAQVTAK